MRTDFLSCYFLIQKKNKDLKFMHFQKIYFISKSMEIHSENVHPYVFMMKMLSSHFHRTHLIKILSGM